MNFYSKLEFVGSKKMAEIEDPTLKENIENVVTKMFKIQWHTVVQEIAIRSLQQN